MIISRIIPERMRAGWRFLRSLSAYGNNPIRFLKYLPTVTSPGSYRLAYLPPVSILDLPVPPPELWLGYGGNAQEYIESGRKDVAKMLSCLEQTGWNAETNIEPVLDLGCGGGRMIRHLGSMTEKAEVWGMDISAPHINWLKTHISPPFNFAVNTTIPHLPFPDGYFGLIYCGSLFTHIDDLCETWFLELRRILSPQGRIYCTIHDKDCLLKIKPENTLWPFVQRMSLLNPETVLPDILVEGSDSDSTVFYLGEYLMKFLARLFDVQLTVQGAYGYQSAYILSRKSK